MQILHLFVFFSLFFVPHWSFAHSKIGEKASYHLDRSRSRTSSIIQSGNFDMEVKAYLPKEEDGPAYHNYYSYDFFLRLIGRKNGTGSIDIDEKAYTQEFINEVKEKGIVTTEDFKIKYVAQKDATTLDGNTYHGCDFLLVYDVNINAKMPIFKLIKIIFGQVNPYLNENIGLPEMEEIENLELLIGMKKDRVPVVGAVKIDLSGSYQGMAFKAGFDFKASEETQG